MLPTQAIYETELQLHVPPDRRRALWAAFARGRVTHIRMQTHYFDTADGGLARSQISLRLRREDERWVQTLKAGGRGGGIARIEHSVIVSARADVTPALDLDRHAESQAYECLREALKRGRRDGADVQLVEVCRTEIDRHLRLLKAAGGAVVEVAFDEGRMIAGGAQQEISEIEFEWKAGPLSGLFSLAEHWLTGHGLWIDTVSKAARGDLLRQSRSHADPVKARPPSVSATTDAVTFAREVIAACLAQVLPNAAAVAQGGASIEHVHQLRVGLRRMRTAVAELAEFNSGLDPTWEAPLADVFRALGESRDKQLLASNCRSELLAAGAPALPTLLTSSMDASPLPLHCVQSAEFQRTLLAAMAFAIDASPAAGPAFDGSPLEALSGRLDHLHRSARRSARHFSSMAENDQHRVRKRLKRLRYLAEFISPLFRGSRVADYFEALEPAQDTLGRRNDAAVALRAYRDEADRLPSAWFAVGWLTAHQESSASTAARALKNVGKAQRFWHGRLKNSGTASRP